MGNTSGYSQVQVFFVDTEKLVEFFSLNSSNYDYKLTCNGHTYFHIPMPVLLFKYRNSDLTRQGSALCNSDIATAFM